MADSRTQYTLRSGKPEHSCSRRPLVATLLLSSLAIASSVGCSALGGISNSLDYNECCDDLMLGYRNSAWSARAWQEKKHCFQNQRYIKDFKAGFRQAYEDVAAGGNGCTPAFPPRSYWSWKYQSPEGQLKTGAWFAGYPMGAKAAEQDGLGTYHTVQCCGELEQSYQQRGMIPGMPAQPMPQQQPAEPIPGMGQLLGEGESIVGEIEVQREGSGVPQPAANPPQGSGSRSPGTL